MYSLPREIHREVIAWLAPEERQIQRIVSRYWAGLIGPARVNLLEFGAIHGVVEFCEIRQSRGDSDVRLCWVAADHGHISILEWMKSREYEPHPSMAANTARNGHLEALKWLIREGFPLNSTLCGRAAKGGHLEVLQWLKSQECPWGSWTCTRAAMGGLVPITAPGTSGLVLMPRSMTD